jgi:hypothetical protein
MHPDEKQRDCVKKVEKSESDADSIPVVTSGAPKTPRTAAKASERISTKSKLDSDSDS